MDQLIWTEQPRELPSFTVVELAKRAILKDPTNPVHYARLSRALQPLAGAEAAEAALRKAIELDPHRANYHLQLGRQLYALGRLEDARSAARRTIECNPRLASAHSLSAELCNELNRPEEAAEAARTALSIDPDLERASNSLIEALWTMGRHKEAEAVCLERVGSPSCSAGTIALYAIILAGAERRGACQQLLDYDRLIRITDLQTDQQAAAELNRELIELVDKRPLLDFEPAGYPVRGGEQFLLYHEQARPCIQTLTKLIKKNVAAHLENQRERTDAHPWLAAAPRKASINLWAVALGQTGHQVSHIHRASWLSGVYYVSVPPIEGENVSAPPGAIRFGAPPREKWGETDIPIRVIIPRPGLLVLFPSFIYHETIPTVSSDLRVSYAFDVVPVE